MMRPLKMNVFLSSTSRDLTKWRDAVNSAINGLDEWHCVRMEDFGPRAETPSQVCRQKVEECDLFVGLVGVRFGETGKDSNDSFTIQEYDAAVLLKKPRLMFLTRDDFPLPHNLTERDEIRARQHAFRQRVKQDHVCGMFDSPEHLALLVVKAMSVWGKQPIPERRERPSMSVPFISSPHPLQENFTGRSADRQVLSEWAASEEDFPVMILSALGGTGKSELSWYWMEQDLPGVKKEFNGLIWWSFYERGGTFRDFVRNTMAYVSGGQREAGENPLSEATLRDLYSVLRSTPFLLILDGMEMLLNAYQGLDAIYSGDDIPSGTDARHLNCADERVGRFLQSLCDPKLKSRILITTRVVPKDIEGLAGCKLLALSNLAPSDAVSFLRKAGVTGAETELMQKCEEYGFHPLCLRLLCGIVINDPSRPGDIASASGWQPDSSTLRRKEHHILQFSYDTMVPDRRHLLSRLAAMRGPAGYAEAKLLSPFDSERSLAEALKELVARNLLLWEKKRVRYDMHPLVRQYAYQRLDNKPGVHIALKTHFAKVPVPASVRTLQELTNAIEYFHHAVCAGHYDEAFVLLKDGMAHALHYTLAAYETYASLIRSLLTAGAGSTAVSDAETREAWLLNSLAIAEAITGRPAHAVTVIEDAILLFKDEARLATAYHNLGYFQMLMGNLRASETSFIRSLKEARGQGRKCRQTGILQHAHGGVTEQGVFFAKSSEASALQEWGLLLAYLGKGEECERKLNAAFKAFRDVRHPMNMAIVSSYRALCAHLGGGRRRAQRELQIARNLYEEASKVMSPQMRDAVRLRLLSGAVHRELGKCAAAESDLSGALSDCRSVRLVEFEPDLLLQLSMLRRRQAMEDGSEARESLKAEAARLAREALSVAQRCEYRLKQADIYIWLSETAFHDGDREAAEVNARRARDCAVCEDSSYGYKRVLDEANTILARLRVR